MATILLATLGFDERHVIRSLLAMGMGGVDKIILLIPSWDMDDRTKKAIHQIRNIAELAGISEEKIIIEKINVEDFWLAVSQIINIFKKQVLRGHNSFKLSLGGGLRILVIEAYTAALLFRSSNVEITVRIDIEAQNKSVEIEPNNIPICYTPSALELLILEKLQEKPVLTITQLSKILKAPKTTIWKIIRKLSEQGFIVKQENKYIPTSKAKTLLTLFKINLIENSH